MIIINNVGSIMKIDEKVKRNWFKIKKQKINYTFFQNPRIMWYQDMGKKPEIYIFYIKVIYTGFTEKRIKWLNSGLAPPGPHIIDILITV